MGNRPGPLWGTAFNGWTGQVKGGETRLDACARKSGPRDKEIAAVERRKTFPWPLISSDPEIMLRHH